jgi:phage major head subunit gpT-like protein
LNITPQAIQFLFQGVKNDFDATLNTAPTYWQKFTDLKTSTRSGEAYFFTDLLPKMRLWVGDRVAQNIAARAYLLQNQDYELTLEVERNRILDDAAGVFAGLGKKIAVQGARWPDQLVVNALNLGDTTAVVCYDNLPFFSSSHLINPDDATQGTQSNLFTTAGSGASPLTSANYLNIRAQMRAWLGANLQPIGVMPDLTVVPPQLEVPALSNVLQSMSDVFVYPYLTAGTTWYQMDTNGIGAMVKPFIFQQRQAPTYVMRTSPTDPAVFDRKVFLHGIDARGNAGVSFPFLAVKCGP